jgi:hypothetical protein
LATVSFTCVLHTENPLWFSPFLDSSAWSVLNLSPAQIGACRHRDSSSSGQPEPPRVVPSYPERRLWVSDISPPFFCTKFVSLWGVLARRSRPSLGRRVFTATGHCSPSPSPNLGIEHPYPLPEAYANLSTPDYSPPRRVLLAGVTSGSLEVPSPPSARLSPIPATPTSPLCSLSPPQPPWLPRPPQRP